MPLTEELQYFADHLNMEKPKTANGEHALEVVKILTEAGLQLEKNGKNINISSMNLPM